MKQALTVLLGVIFLALPTGVFTGDCGDVNNSGTTNLLDITHLINYLYNGGPAPYCKLSYDSTSTVTDIDGNVYQTVKIGDQWWMMENLKVTHYRNGDPIPHVTDNSTWEGLTTGAYCAYENDENDVETYGRLYNWYAVDDSRNIAPEGWRVSTDEDWKQLEMYLGLSSTEADSMGWRGTDEGGMLKETGITLWASPNTGATNESGFSALPGGYRSSDNDGFFTAGYLGYWWSSTTFDSQNAWYHSLNYNVAGVYRYCSIKQLGFSVRCVRDESN